MRVLTLLFVLLAANAAAADRTPGVVANLTGTLRIQQEVPCADDVDQTTPVSGGRLELTPAEGVAVGTSRRFALTRAKISFADFSIHRSCAGIASETRSFSDVTVEVTSLPIFTAAPAGGDTYAIDIPPDAVLLYKSAIVNDELENSYLRPSQDVTGSVNLATGAVQFHVVVQITTRFRAGCSFLGCILDTERPGTLTADVAGTIAFPDADGDGVPDRDDNCRFVANPDQTPVPTPVVTPPPPITLTSCIDHTIGVASAVDVCDGTPVTITNDAPAAFHAGLNVVTWTGVDGKGRTGTATQNVTVNDTTPPTVSCTGISPQGNSFVVAADDICGEPVIRLGTFVLNDGEQIKIEETGQDGVTFIDLVNGFRHFHVGKGQAIVTATDSSGNTASAVCR